MRLVHTVRMTRLAMLWEQWWPCLVAPVLVVLIFLSVSWFGLWLAVHGLLQVLLLVAFAVLFIASLWPLTTLRRITRNEAVLRVEAVSELKHQPLQTLLDKMALSENAEDALDPRSRALWQAHQRRARQAIAQTRITRPQPRLHTYDVLALRFAIGLVGLVAFFWAPGERVQRVMAAFSVTMPADQLAARVDAWISPPPYTDRPPIVLISDTLLAGGDELPNNPADPENPKATTRSLNVPQNSELTVRIGADSDLRVATDRGGSLTDLAPTSGANRTEVAAAASAQDREPRHYRLKLADSQTIYIKSRWGTAAAWTFQVEPDAPPTIRQIKDPETALTGALKLFYGVEDDFGVVRAEARFANPRQHDVRGKNTDKAARPLYQAPQFRLSLPRGRTRKGEASTFRNLISHPWAGADVDLTYAAFDDMGNEGLSQTYPITLPQRQFNDPLARALAEQRLELALDANQASQVVVSLDAILFAPEKHMQDLGAYLGIRTAQIRLRKAKTDDALRDVADMLWEIAISIEDGDLSHHEQALRRAREELMQALEEGADEKELKRLVDQLRQAMRDYMQALAQQQMQNPDQMQAPLDPNTRLVRPQDLERMLDRLEDLSQLGARDAARELLSQLDEMMENLRQAGRQQMQQAEQGEMNELLSELGEIIRRQQQLMDETNRQARQGRGGREGRGQRRQQSRREQQGQGQDGSQGQHQDGLSENRGNEGRQGQGGRGGTDGLGEEQAALQERLNQLMDRLRERGALGEEGADFDRAYGEMGEAIDGLRGRRPGDAVDNQAQALDALRQGAQAMLRQLQQNGMMQGRMRGQGQTDPLGRPLRNTGPDFGDTVEVPDDIEVQRARRILRELRRRLGEPQRGLIERGYIERLLERF